MKARFCVKICAFLAFVLVFLQCQENMCAAVENKTLLILNSYDESELWANDMSETVATYLASVPSVSCDIVNLDNAMIYGREDFDRMSDYIFNLYRDDHPSYVVMVGDFAFALRARIKEEWGDIPILLISKIPNYNTLETNFVSDSTAVSLSDGSPLSTLKARYNFTVVYAPSYYEETVDLMMSMIPDMKDFVFFSTNIYVSKVIADGIKRQLALKYPGVSFRWVQANLENYEEFRDYLIKPHPQTGLLLSNWVYEKESAREILLPSGNDVRLIVSSKTPIFSLREVYKTIGCIGGVFNDADEMKDEIVSRIRKIILGTEARDIPFYISENKFSLINYRLLQEYGIPEDRCPEGTEFFNKPLSYWEKYLWHTLVAILLAVIVVGAFIVALIGQKRRISRLRYNQFFLSNMPLPFTQARVIYSREGKVVNISYTKQNKAFEELVRVNAIPGNEFILFPADFISEKTEQLLKTRKNVEFTYHFRHTGKYYFFTLATVMVKEASWSDTTGIIDIFARDITNSTRARLKVQSYARKLDLTLRVAKMIPWRWNILDGSILLEDRGLFAHDQHADFQWSEEAEMTIMFSDFLKRVYPDDLPIIEKSRADYISGATDSQVLQLRLYRDGAPDGFDWVELNSALTSSEEGSDLVVTGSLHIITEKKKQEQEMALALERAQEADRMKSTFLANMSHEIRTPLNAIVGFSNLLVDLDNQAERKEFADIINLNNELLLALVSDVLDLAKIEANTMDLHFSYADINEILYNARQTVSMRVERGVALNVVVGKENCIAEVDPIRLSQVIMNLMTNACKFTSEGSITLGYEIRGGHTMYFYVKDTGMGIDPLKKDTVFDRFVKLNGFKQGTGLGLSICKRLVEMMGGEIGVESEGLGKGSCFWFNLPYKPGAEDEASAASKGISSDAIVPDELNSFNHELEDMEEESLAHLNSMSAGEDDGLPLVLVAEDDNSNYTLANYLLRQKFNTIRAANGREAVEKFCVQRPALILMDINMPIMDGYEAVARIREIDSKVPIIALTAYAYASDKGRILRSGFNEYVTKPVSQPVLMAAIDKVCSKTGGACPKSNGLK